MKISEVGIDNGYAIVRGWVGSDGAATDVLIGGITDGATATDAPATLEFAGLTVTDLGSNVTLVASSWKIPVRCATTTNGTLATAFAAGQVVDGITLATSDRVLLKNQTTASENGIYTVNASGAPSRSLDLGLSALVDGAVVDVVAGTANAASLWMCTNQTAPVLDTDAITFALINGTVVGGAVVGAAGTGAYTVEIQNPQSDRFLQQDGTFRDPLLVGAGTLTVGSLSTITDDTKYNSWPAVCRMRNGQLIAIYYKGTGHDTDNTGNVVAKIGTEAIDGSVSWGSEITVYDHASLSANPAGVSSSSTGRVFASVMRFNVSVANTGEAGIVYSDDFGVTWSAWIALTNGFTQEAYSAGPAVELPNGSLLVTIEGTNSGTAAANRSSHTVLSTDAGLTWGSEVTVRNYITDTRPYYESQLLLLNNAGADELIVLHRTSNGTGNIYIQRSTDLGATTGGWGTPAIAFAGYGRPGTIQRWTGTLVATTRRNSDAAVVAFVSTDLGVTWDAGTAIATGMTESEYAFPVDLLTTGLLIVYGTQPSASLTNADIKSAPVAEALTSLRSGGVTTAAASGPNHAHVNNATFNGDGATVAFILPAAPVDTYAVSVYVGTGRNNDWTLSGALNDTITFGSAPTTGTNNISIDIVAALA